MVGAAGREVGQQPVSNSGSSLLMGRVGLGAAWHLETLGSAGRAAREMGFLKCRN